MDEFNDGAAAESEEAAARRELIEMLADLDAAHIYAKRAESNVRAQSVRAKARNQLATLICFRLELWGASTIFDHMNQWLRFVVDEPFQYQRVRWQLVDLGVPVEEIDALRPQGHDAKCRCVLCKHGDIYKTLRKAAIDE